MLQRLLQFRSFQTVLSPRNAHDFAHMRRQLHAVGCLVERTVEGGDEEHNDLSAHAEEQHEVGSRQVGQFEERTQDDDGGAPAVCVVHERLARHAVEPLLQTIDNV